MDYSQEPAFTEGSQEKSIKLHDAMQQAAEDLMQSKPDLIIFSTPHGFHLTDNNVILSTPSVCGIHNNYYSANYHHQKLEPRIKLVKKSFVNK